MAKHAIGSRISYNPSLLSTWSSGDEWSNEFSVGLDRALSDDEFDEYYEWSQRRQSGVVIDLDAPENHDVDIDFDPECGEEYVVVRLDSPPSFCPVAFYPIEVFDEEMWIDVFDEEIL